MTSIAEVFDRYDLDLREDDFAQELARTLAGGPHPVRLSDQLFTHLQEVGGLEHPERLSRWSERDERALGVSVRATMLADLMAATVSAAQAAQMLRISPSRLTHKAKQIPLFSTKVGRQLRHPTRHHLRTGPTLTAGAAVLRRRGVAAASWGFTFVDARAACHRSQLGSRHRRGRSRGWAVGAVDHDRTRHDGALCILGIEAARRAAGQRAVERAAFSWPRWMTSPRVSVGDSPRTASAPPEPGCCGPTPRERGRCHRRAWLPVARGHGDSAPGLTPRQRWWLAASALRDQLPGWGVLPAGGGPGQEPFHGRPEHRVLSLGDRAHADQAALSRARIGRVGRGRADPHKHPAPAGQ